MAQQEQLLTLDETAKRLGYKSKASFYKHRAKLKAFGLQITELNRVRESSLNICIKAMAEAGN